jgi:hypothetical protein
MRILKVRQIDLKNGCEHIAIHSFPFPEFRDKGFYRTVTSYSAFFDSIKRRNSNENYLFYVIRNDVPPTAYEIERDAILPVKEHSDLYSFFEYIGYDRSSKKYTNL